MPETFLRPGQIIYRQRRLRQNIAASVVAAAADANARTAASVIALAEVIAQGIAKEELAKAHTTVARAAQRSIVASYDQTVTARKKNRDPYRVSERSPNNRYAGGALRDALESDRMWRADARGFSLINVRILDQEARHWARLNAGAGPAGRGSRRQFEIRFSNLVVATIGANMSARPAFSIPRGYWFDGEIVGPSSARVGSDSFYPLGTGPRRRLKRGSRRLRGGLLQERMPTRGIEARNFLDAGFATVADRLGPTYMAMLDDLFDKGKLAAEKRPRAFRSSVRTIYRY